MNKKKISLILIFTLIIISIMACLKSADVYAATGLSATTNVIEKKTKGKVTMLDTTSTRASNILGLFSVKVQSVGTVGKKYFTVGQTMPGYCCKESDADYNNSNGITYLYSDSITTNITGKTAYYYYYFNNRFQAATSNSAKANAILYLRVWSENSFNETKMAGFAKGTTGYTAYHYVADKNALYSQQKASTIALNAKFDPTAVQIQTNGAKYIAGPFYIDVTGTPLPTIALSGVDQNGNAIGTITGGGTLCNSAGTKITLPLSSGTNQKVYISYSSQVPLTTIKATFSWQYGSSWKATTSKWTPAWGQQKLVIDQATQSTVNKSFSITFGTTELVGLNIQKYSRDGDNLPVNADFTVTATQNGNNILTGNTVTTNNGSGTAAVPLALKPVDSSDIAITITETRVESGYAKLSGAINVTLSDSGGAWTASPATGTLPGGETYAVTIDASGNIIFTIRDIPIIKLGGQVWNDIVHNDKVGQRLDGKMGTDPNTGKPEPMVQGVHVTLMDASTKSIATDIYGNPVPDAITGSDGKYTFGTADGQLVPGNASTVGCYLDAAKSYYVIFTYDGVNYQAELNVGDSKVITENNRADFNSKFTQISGTGNYADNGIATDSNGKVYSNQLNYDATTPQDGSENKGTAYLKTITVGGVHTYPKLQNNVLIMGGTGAKDGVDQIYKMQAATNTYSFDTTNPDSTNSWQKTWNSDVGVDANGVSKDKTGNGAFSITMGLANRNTDLALTKDVSSATVTINGKTTTYNYGSLIKDSNGNLSLPAATSMGNNNNTIKYNLNLYSSDYNFRLNSNTYTQSVSTASNVNNSVSNTVDPTDAQKNSAELAVQVTYAIVINNQSFTVTGPDGNALYDNTVKVDSIVDYVDSSYTYIDGSATYSQYGSKDAYTAPVVAQGSPVTIDGVQYNTLNITGLDQPVSDGGQQIILLTFEVNKDSSGNVMTGNKYNYAEIKSYTTAAGLVDKDSAPGNMLKSDGTAQIEDDTDQAPGLNVNVQDPQRTITGTVWDDTSSARQDGTTAGTWNPGNGTIDTGEKPVNDVIVQLIELKNIGGKNYEYVWQETTSGSSKVNAVPVSGGDAAQYDNGGVGQGGYKFTGYIPGNYIVRYIYGDGTYQYYDASGNKISTPNDVKQYNGNDYQSTVDNSTNPYNAANFNFAGTSTADNKARDNEARRLEVMSKSILIDNATGLALRDGTNLADTWMCAETSTIVVAPDGSNGNGNTTITASTVTPTLINNVNFGLQQRPRQELTLDKHLTALTATPAGGTPIVDTANNINASLAKIMGSRDNRGEWAVASDAELNNGLHLQATYTYTVTNNGDIDYLSSALVKAYTDDTSADYGNYVNGLATYDANGVLNGGVALQAKDGMKTGAWATGTALGQAYYTGTPATTDAIVPARAEALDEAINNDLSFTDDSSSDFQKDNTAPVDKKVFDVDGIERTVQINTVVTTKTPTNYLTPVDTSTTKTADTRKIFLTRVTSANDSLTYPSYIAEIKALSNAAGRRDVSVPGNLQYVHSDDSNLGLTPSTSDYSTDGTTTRTDWPGNQPDESWGETITLAPPQGGAVDKGLLPVYIAIIGAASLIVIGGAVFGIKKFVLGKK